MDEVPEIVVGIDIGGTFTDFVALNRRTAIVAQHKELTTPDEPQRAVLHGLDQLLQKMNVAMPAVAAIVHGTTLATNLLIERKGAQVGLLTTEGFADVVEIARERRFDAYNLAIEPPTPLVSAPFRREIVERTLADGTVAVLPSEESIRQAVEELRSLGCRTIAVAFLFAPVNPGNERTVRAVSNAVDPQLYVSLSSEVDGHLGEYERASTTVVNAYIQPTVSQYLARLEDSLLSGGYRNQLFVMLSGGGVARSTVAKEYPVRFIESGPVGGVMASASLAQRLGIPRVVAFDMGGTTAKIAVVNDYTPDTATSFEVARVEWHREGSGLPVRSPMVELIEIGLGGGSIARVDALGAVAVGPDSAGAMPGPACYGRGGRQPTNTDADVVLGYIDPVAIAGGSVAINKEAAQAAIGTLADALQTSIEECAWAIHCVANEEMAISARLHLMERGYEPRDFALVVSGGAGPVHAGRLAEILEISRVVYPLGAGVMSALGFVTSPVGISVGRPVDHLLDDIDADQAIELLNGLEQDAREECRHAGVVEDAVSIERLCRVSCQGQRDELEVELDIDPSAAEDLKTELVLAISHQFARTYKALFGIERPAVPLHVTGWRVVAQGPSASFSFIGERRADGVSDNACATRRAYFPEGDGWTDVPVMRRSDLVPGATFAGPVIVEDPASTTVIGPNWQARVDGTTLAIVADKIA